MLLFKKNTSKWPVAVTLPHCIELLLYYLANICSNHVIDLEVQSYDISEPFAYDVYLCH